MKHRYFKSLLAILFLMVGAKAFAYDAEINGIYYNFSETEAAVTYYSRDYYYNSSSYRGNVVIPASVTYNGKTYTVTSIGIYAFDDCSSLTSVTIPEGVTSIGDRAFSGCSGLISITIPESVASIGYSAFYGCSSLTSITIPEGVTSIGSYAFDGCSGLTSVKVLITDNALFLNNRIAEQIKNSRSTNIQLIDGEGAEIKNFVVPNSVNIISVYAFYNCRGLTSITIPESVTSIGSSAFEGCSGMTSITIPESVKSIGSSVFSGCSGLTSVTINCPSIGSWFSGLTSIKEITLGNKVTSIGSSAFKGCRGLASITIPEGVTSIGSSAFSGCSLASVTINCPTIGSWFSGLTSIKEITLGNKVKSIGSSAFEGCSGLTSITIPEGVTSIGESAFYNCSSLTSITIPESVTSIGNAAFSGCSGLTSVTIPEGVTSIGDRAFYGCSGLTSINIPEGVTSIGNYAFWGCSLASVTINCPTIDSWFSGLTSIKEITLGNKVTSIGSSAFKGCSGLTSITIPESVTSIGSYAFEGCSGLTSIKIPEGVTNIGSSAFSNCSSLTSITIPESVTSIGEGAFSNCSGLTSINIPESVVSLGKGVFKDSNIDTLYISDLNKWCQIEMGENTWGKHLLLKGEEVKDVVIPEGQEKVGAYTFCGINIRSVAFPNSVKEIGDGAFKGCADLTKVVITNGVETIGSEAFMDAGLTSVVIPNSVKSIGEKAFANCIGLYSVTSLINSPFKLDPTAFTYYNKDYDANSIYYGATLYVPRGRKSFYEMIDGWKTFLKIEENDMKYKMTYYLNDEEYKTYEIQAGEVVTPEPDPVLVGCVFNGWSSIPRVMPAEDVIVKGTYTVNKYKIRYYDGDKLIAEDEVDYGAEVVLRDYTPEDAARYTFIGWDGEKYETMPAHDIEYHANIVDGVSRLERVPEGVEAIYDANGRKLRKLQRGVNVVVMSDGTKKKVVVK